MRIRLAAGLVALAVVAPMVSGYAIDAHHADAGTPTLGPGVVTVQLDARYSRFSPDHLRVYQGTLVRFVVTNHDPINHEFIVGNDDVHTAHEAGHEAFHPPVPGEVSLDAGETGLTTYLFDDAGTVRFACHMPGHLAYGMKGTVTVIAA